jgi:hypothetical protein
MKIEIGKEHSDRTKTCKFDQKCLEEFDSSLCCNIIKEGPHYLLVDPVSTFKSSNCSYIRQIKNDDQEVQICSCPVRLEIFKKYKI